MNEQIRGPRLKGLRLGILVSQYPARSHTFVRREVAELRAQGADVRMFAVRKTPDEDLIDDLDREAARTTTSILPATPLQLARAHLSSWFTTPVTYAQTSWDAFTHRLPGARNFVWTAFYLAEATILAHELKAQGVQHLHAHFANSGANIARLAAKLAGITWSMTLHGACDFEYPFGPTLPDKVREAAFTICISRYGMAQAMREVDPVHWPSIGLSRCGIELSEMPPPRGPAQNDGPLNVVCVGRLSAEKGHLGLLEGFAEAQKQAPALRLTFVGDGPLRSRIESRIEELGLCRSVTLAGFAAEREALHQISRGDIVVLASFMEGIPVVLMEAMTLRVPVLAPRLAGIPELIEDGVSGLLFHPADWDELADKLTTLAHDAQLRERLARAGQAKIANGFAMPQAIDGFV